MQPVPSAANWRVPALNTIADLAAVPRPDIDQLKATLTNCIRQGPASQNLDHHPDFHSHLAGRVAFVERINPTKAGRLRDLLDQIVSP